MLWEGIQRAMHLRHGWVFVSGHGIYASASFTGPLSPLLRPSCAREITAVRQSGTRAIIHLDRDHEVLVTDGATLGPAPLPGATDVAWRDDGMGALIVGHDTLQMTRDGGRSWVPIALGPHLPLQVLSDGARMRVETTGGAYDLGDAGELGNESTEHIVPPASFALDLSCIRVTSPPPSRSEWLGREMADCRREDRRPPPSPTRMTRADTHSVDVRLRGLHRAPLADEREGLSRPMDHWGAPALATWNSFGGDGLSDYLSCRGRDEQGPFLQRIPLPRDERNNVLFAQVIAATRRALIVLVGVPDAGSIVEEHGERRVTKPYWAAADHPHRLDWLPMCWASSASAVALADGSMMLRVVHECPSMVQDRGVFWCRNVVSLARVTPTGEVAQWRAWDGASFDHQLDAFGAIDGRWGILSWRGPESDELDLHTLDGADLPFGRLDVGARLTPCADAAAPGVRQVRIDARLGRWHFTGALGDMPALGQGSPPPMSLDLELLAAPGRACVRRASAVRRIADNEGMPAVVRLAARGGRLVGDYDDGTRIGEAEGTIDR